LWELAEEVELVEEVVVAEEAEAVDRILTH
jgi:hypothetical protein